MKKEELVHLHMQLVQVKKYYEDCNPGYNFNRYNDLGITPIQVHRRKEEHKQAVFVLLTELASITNSLSIGIKKAKMSE